LNSFKVIMRSIRVIFYVLLSTGTSADHITEDKLVNRAFQMQSSNFADLDTTTLGKPQKKPNIPQEKAMTEETRAYIILSAVAACMGFLLIWWKAMQKVTQNGNLSLPLMDNTIKTAVDQPAPKTSASVYAKQRQQKDKQPLHPRVAAALGKTSAYEQPTTEQHLGAIEGYSAEEIMKLWDWSPEWNKVIAGERLPSAIRQWEPKTPDSAVSGSKAGLKSISKSHSKSDTSNLTFATSPVSPIIRSSKAQCGGGGGQARYGQRASPFKQMSTTESVQQTRDVKRALSADTHRKPVVGTPSVPFGSSRVISCQRTLPRVIR